MIVRPYPDDYASYVYTAQMGMMLCTRCNKGIKMEDKGGGEHIYSCGCYTWKFGIPEEKPRKRVVGI